MRKGVYLSRLIFDKKLSSSLYLSSYSYSYSSSTFFSTSSTTVSSKDIFDRELKKRQRDISFHKIDSDYYDYLKVKYLYIYIYIYFFKINY